MRGERSLHMPACLVLMHRMLNKRCRRDRMLVVVVDKSEQMGFDLYDL